MINRDEIDQLMGNLLIDSLFKQYIERMLAKEGTFYVKRID